MKTAMWFWWWVPIMVAYTVFAFATNTRQDTDEGNVELAFQDQTLPEWVTVFQMARKPGEPLMEFRILIHARSEGEAVMKSTILINRTFGVNAIEVLEFKEAALAKEEKKK